jgi:hypothetical protein
VQLELAHPEIAVNVPASALIVGQDGLRVATLGADDRVVLKTVTIARDLGKVVEVASGLTADDRVIENPPDGISSGDAVRLAVAPGSKLAPETASAKRAPAKPPG